MTYLKLIFLNVLFILSASTWAKGTIMEAPNTLESACSYVQSIKLTKKQPPLSYDSKKTNLCLRFILWDLSREKKVDQALINKLVSILLPTNPADKKGLQTFKQFDIDYEKIASIISLSKSQNLLKHYLDFILFTSGSADEVRSNGLGKLYSLQAPVFIDMLSKYSKKEKALIINSLAFGLRNNYYPHMNKTNYKRLIVGEYWELLLDKEYKNSDIVREIEAALSKTFNNKK